LESRDVVVDLEISRMLQASGVQGHVVVDFCGDLLVDDSVAKSELGYAEALAGLVDHAQVLQELSLHIFVLVEIESEGILVRVKILGLLRHRAAREVQYAVVKPKAQGVLVDGDLWWDEHLFALFDLEDEQTFRQVDLLQQKLDVKDFVYRLQIQDQLDFLEQGILDVLVLFVLDHLFVILGLENMLAVVSVVVEHEQLVCLVPVYELQNIDGFVFVED